MFSVLCRKSAIAIVAVCVTPLIGCNVLATATSINSSTDVPAVEYEHAQTLIALTDGRRLNLFCMGIGKPVVILEAGGGDDSLTFRRVQGRLSTVTRVCSYDRAGMGFSDPSDAPNTAAHIVSDLHELINNADIPKPIVLVGHSNGGLYASLYASIFPEDVAGLVMIDPNNLGLDLAAEKVLDQPWLKQWRDNNVAEIMQARYCLILAKNGALTRAPTRHPKCMDNPPNADLSLRRLLNMQLARPSEQKALLTELIDTEPQTNGSLSNAEVTLQRSHFNFGDKPLIVLSGTNEQDDLTPAELTKVTKAMLANHADLAARSTRGKQVLVSSKTEYIQTFRPGTVVRSVTEIVEKVRDELPVRKTEAILKKI